MGKGVLTKNLLASTIIFVLCGSALANVTYHDPIDMYLVRTDTFYWSWYHNNPAETEGGMTPEEYEQAVLNGNISSVSLTIVVDSLSQNDTVNAWIQDKDYNWYDLGPLNSMSFSDDWGLIRGSEAYLGHQTSTIFSIEPGWLNGLPVAIRVVGDLSNPIEIETSTLSVTTMFPAPGAILLGGIGVCLVGWLRRRRTL